MSIIEYNPDISMRQEDFIKSNLYKIEPIKKITVFFDRENFLLSEYITDKSTTFVAEGWNGNQLHLLNLNCGYGGGGPTNTARFLIDNLNVDEDIAFRLIHNPGLQLEFDKEGNLLEDKITTNFFFSSQIEHKEKCKVFLNNYTYVDQSSRKLYFINPQIDCIKDVFNAIDKITPYELQYFIGKNSPLDSGYLPRVRYNTHDSKMEGLTGVNLILRGRQLDLLFLIDKSVARSFVNIIHSYILKAPLFDDANIIKHPDRTFKRFLIDILLKSDNTDYHGVEKIETRKGSKWTY